MGVDIGLVPTAMWAGSESTIDARRVPGAPEFGADGWLGLLRSTSDVRRLLTPLSPLARLLVLAGHAIDFVAVRFGADWITFDPSSFLVELHNGERPLAVPTDLGEPVSCLVIRFHELPLRLLEGPTQPAGGVSLPVVLDAAPSTNGLGASANGPGYSWYASDLSGVTPVTLEAVIAAIATDVERLADGLAGELAAAWNGSTSAATNGATVAPGSGLLSGLLRVDQSGDHDPIAVFTIREAVGAALDRYHGAMDGGVDWSQPVLPPAIADELIANEGSAEPETAAELILRAAAPILGDNWLQFYTPAPGGVLARLTDRGIDTTNSTLCEALFSMHRRSLCDAFAEFAEPVAATTNDLVWAAILAGDGDQLDADQVVRACTAVEQGDLGALSNTVLDYLASEYKRLADDGASRTRIRDALISVIERSPHHDDGDIRSARTHGVQLAELLSHVSSTINLDDEVADTWARYQIGWADLARRRQLASTATLVFVGSTETVRVGVVQAVIDCYRAALAQANPHWSYDAALFDGPFVDGDSAGWSLIVANEFVRMATGPSPAFSGFDSAVNEMIGLSPAELMSAGVAEDTFHQVLAEHPNPWARDYINTIATMANYRADIQNLDHCRRFNIIKCREVLEEALSPDNPQNALAAIEDARLAAARSALPSEPRISIEGTAGPIANADLDAEQFTDAQFAWMERSGWLTYCMNREPSWKVGRLDSMRLQMALVDPRSLTQLDALSAGLEILASSHELLQYFTDGEIEAHVEDALPGNDPAYFGLVKQGLKLAKSSPLMNKELVTVLAGPLYGADVPQLSRVKDETLTYISRMTASMEASGVITADRGVVMRGEIDRAKQVAAARPRVASYAQGASVVIGGMATLQLMQDGLEIYNHGFEITVIDGLQLEEGAAIVSTLGNVRDAFVGGMDLCRLTSRWSGPLYTSVVSTIVSAERAGSSLDWLSALPPTVSFISGLLSTAKYTIEAVDFGMQGQYIRMTSRGAAAVASGASAYFAYVGIVSEGVAASAALGPAAAFGLLATAIVTAEKVYFDWWRPDYYLEQSMHESVCRHGLVFDENVVLEPAMPGDVLGGQPVPEFHGATPGAVVRVGPYGEDRDLEISRPDPDQSGPAPVYRTIYRMRTASPAPAVLPVAYAWPMGLLSAAPGITWMSSVPVFEYAIPVDPTDSGLQLPSEHWLVASRIPGTWAVGEIEGGMRDPRTSRAADSPSIQPELEVWVEPTGGATALAVQDDLEEGSDVIAGSVVATFMSPGESTSTPLIAPRTGVVIAIERHDDDAPGGPGPSTDRIRIGVTA